MARSQPVRRARFREDGANFAGVFQVIGEQVAQHDPGPVVRLKDDAGLE